MQKGKGGDKFDKRRHLGVEAVVMPRPNVVAVIDVMRLIPVGRIEPSDGNELSREHEQKRDDSEDSERTNPAKLQIARALV